MAPGAIYQLAMVDINPQLAVGILILGHLWGILNAAHAITAKCDRLELVADKIHILTHYLLTTTNPKNILINLTRLLNSI